MSAPECTCEIEYEDHTAGIIRNAIVYCPLHAAAPQMYEALEYCVTTMVAHQSVKPHMTTEIGKARAALAAARGEQL